MATNASETNHSISESPSTNLNEIIQLINLYYPITLSVIATIGNVLSFLVFSSKIFKNNASGFYLRVKAITDILNVYIGTLRFSYSALNTGADLKDQNVFFCYFFSISVYTIDPITSWLNVFTSVDRLVLVLKPSFYRSISNQALKRFQIILIMTTFVAVLGLNLMKISYIVFTITEKFDKNGSNATKILQKCVATNAIIIDWVNLAITLVIPFVIMTGSSSIMAYNLIKSKSKLNKNKGKNAGFWSKNIAFIKTVVCLDICFLMFNLPRFVLQLKKGNSPTFIFVLQISTVFKYSYYSMTILFYILTNNLFRDSLWESCCRFLGGKKNFAYKKNKVSPRQQ